MGWVLAGGLAVVSFIVLAFVLKLPRRGWEATAAALLLGLAGYALQGSPAEKGAPKERVEKITKADADGDIAARDRMSDATPMGDKLLVTADAFARHGQYADAAETLRIAVRKEPQSVDAWLSMANALVAHADNNLTPAALYAFTEANRANPDHPGPPFFLGLALAQSGRLQEGRAMWAQLLERTPPDAPWRGDLQAKLASLDAFIARQNGMGTQP